MQFSISHPKLIQFFQLNPRVSPENLLVALLPVFDLVSAADDQNAASKLDILFNQFYKAHADLHSDFKSLLLESQNSYNQSFNHVVDVIHSKNDSLKNSIDSALGHNRIQPIIHNALVERNSDVVQAINDSIHSHVSHLQSSFHDNINASSQNVALSLNNAVQPLHSALSSVQSHLESHKISQLNSSIKGGVSENKLKASLVDAFPHNHITDSHKFTASGDFIVHHHECGDILIENKDYSDNVASAEVDKFFRDVQSHKCHGIFISQNSGIALRDDFHVQFAHGFVYVFLHKVRYQTAPLLQAASVIKHLQHFAASNELPDNLNSPVDVEQFNLIIKEWKKDAEIRNSIVHNLQAQIKLLKDPASPTLEAIIKARCPVHAQARVFICPVCNKSCKSKSALISHQKIHESVLDNNSVGQQ